MMKENKKNALTELQEKSLLKASAAAGWLAFWGLLIAIVVQMFMDDYTLRNVAGETIVFLLLDAQIIMSCIKNGVWGKKLMSNLKTNVILSFISAVIVGLVSFFIDVHYGTDKTQALTYAGTVAAVIFAAMTVILTISAFIRGRKVKKIESEEEKDAVNEEGLNLENKLPENAENAPAAPLDENSSDVPVEDAPSLEEEPAAAEEPKEEEPKAEEPKAEEPKKENKFFSKFLIKDDLKDNKDETK